MVKKKKDKGDKKDSGISDKIKKKIIRKIKSNIKIIKEGSEKTKSNFEGVFGDLAEKESEWVSEEQEAAAVGLGAKKNVKLEEVANERVLAQKDFRTSPKEGDSQKDYISGKANQTNYARNSDSGGEYVRSFADNGGEYIQNLGDNAGGEYQVSGGKGPDASRGYEVKDDRNYNIKERKKKEEKEKDRLKRPWEI